IIWTPEVHIYPLHRLLRSRHLLMVLGLHLLRSHTHLARLVTLIHSWFQSKVLHQLVKPLPPRMSKSLVHKILLALSPGDVCIRRASPYSLSPENRSRSTIAPVPVPRPSLPNPSRDYPPSTDKSAICLPAASMIHLIFQKQIRRQQVLS